MPNFLNLSIQDIVKSFKKFREKDIKYFIKKKIIEFPLTEEDFIKLQAIHLIWRQDEAIRLQLSGKKKKDIQRIIEHAQHNSKLEAWIYSRIMNLRAQNKKIYIKKLTREAIKNFKFKNTPKVRQQISQIIKRMRRKKFPFQTVSQSQ